MCCTKKKLPNPTHIATNTENVYTCFLLTYEELAVELQVEVSVSRSLLRGGRKLVHPEQRLLHVPLSSDSVPPVVVQLDARLDADLQRPVTHIEGENHLSGGYKPNR